MCKVGKHMCSYECVLGCGPLIGWSVSGEPICSDFPRSRSVDSVERSRSIELSCGSINTTMKSRGRAGSDSSQF